MGWRRTAGVLVLVMAAAGCTGDADAPAGGVPEMTGEHADIAFLQMMVLHHRQALDLAELVPDRAEDQRVVDVAARIEAAQAPEILVMAQWLTEHNVDVPPVGADPAEYDHGEHGHSAMQGMLSDEQLAAVADTTGADFDALFLESMITHHEGAVAMALDVLEVGEDPRVNELANDINAGQSAEIARLQALLDDLVGDER